MAAPPPKRPFLFLPGMRLPPAEPATPPSSRSPHADAQSQEPGDILDDDFAVLFGGEEFRAPITPIGSDAMNQEQEEVTLEDGFTAGSWEASPQAPVAPIASIPLAAGNQEQVAPQHGIVTDDHQPEQRSLCHKEKQRGKSRSDAATSGQTSGSRAKKGQTGGWKLKCRFCGQVFTRPEILRKHMAAIHNLQHPKANAVCCQNCGKIWIDEKDIPGTHKDKPCGGTRPAYWLDAPQQWTRQLLADTFAMIQDGELSNEVKFWCDADGNPAEAPAAKEKARQMKQAKDQKRDAEANAFIAAPVSAAVTRAAVIDLTYDPATVVDLTDDPVVNDFDDAFRDLERFADELLDPEEMQELDPEALQCFVDGTVVRTEAQGGSKRKRDDDGQAVGRNIRERTPWAL